MLSYEEYFKLHYPDIYEALFVRKKSTVEELVDLCNNRYICPSCGKKFIFDHKIECLGHGDYVPVVWMRCSCGIRTKCFYIYDQSDIDRFFSFLNKFKR